VDGLTNDLRKKYKGQKIILKSYIGDEEAFWLCSQLWDIAKKAEMDPQYGCANEPLTRNLPVVDIQVLAPTIPEAEALSWPLKGPGRIPGYFVDLNTSPVLAILVGVKRSLPIWPPQKPETRKNNPNISKHKH
jgi:hypothetical protein